MQLWCHHRMQTIWESGPSPHPSSRRKKVHVKADCHSTAVHQMNFPVERFHRWLCLVHSQWKMQKANTCSFGVLIEENIGTEKVFRACGDEIMQPGSLTEAVPIGRVSSGLSFWSIVTEKEKNKRYIQLSLQD